MIDTRTVLQFQRVETKISVTFTYLAIFKPRKNLAMSWSDDCHGRPLALTTQLLSTSSFFQLQIQLVMNVMLISTFKLFEIKKKKKKTTKSEQNKLSIIRGNKTPINIKKLFKSSPYLIQNYLHKKS